MSKYIIIEVPDRLAIPAEFGNVLSQLKFVERKWSKDYSANWLEWTPELEPEIQLVEDSQIRRPQPEAPEKPLPPVADEAKPDDLEPL